MAEYPLTTKRAFQRTGFPFWSRLSLKTNFPSIIVLPVAALRGTRRKTLRSLIDASSSLQAANHLGASGEAKASAREQGSSGLVVTSISVDSPHSKPSL